MSFNIENAVLNAEKKIVDIFAEIDRICSVNTEKVLRAFWNNKVSEPMLHGTTGYGYDDRGREVLDRIYAEVFDCEDALVSHRFVSGTHTLSTAFSSLLFPGDTMYSVTGAPYDTLLESIGVMGEKGRGSLADYGIHYKQTELLEDGNFDLVEIGRTLDEDKSVKVVFIQRSRGYTQRKALSIAQIESICSFIKERSDAYIVVDNCYGEFVCEKEPTSVGADLIAGSLIKNPGGGLAPTGGYIAGKHELVELCAQRHTAVGIGKECGATLDLLRMMYQGFFLAPHIVAQAMKTAVFAAELFSSYGFTVDPLTTESRSDIIQTVIFNDPQKMLCFMRGIQAGAPIDSFVTPEPWAMPGYSDAVVMAAGAFVGGASIELSADSPMKEPYRAYFQGGLTYESGKIAIVKALEIIKSEGGLNG